MSGFLLNQFKKKNILIFLVISTILILAVLFSGERSNSIKAIFGFSLFILLIKEINLKYRISIILSCICLTAFLIININWLNIRFVSNLKSIFKSHTIYFDLYKSGFNVFKNNKLFGVGNKNYRIETCSNINLLNEDEDKKYYYCNNHPHQIYFELLSEHGIIGTFIIIFILFKLVFSKILQTFYKSNYLKIGSLIYIIFVFTPLIPSGAFFTNILITIFMINLSIFFAVDKESNIFSYNFSKKKLYKGPLAQ